MKNIRFSTRIIIIAAVAALVAGGLGPRVRVWAGERYLSGRPEQFFSWNVIERASGYGAIVAIAHNAGDDPITTQRALGSGAAYIEIDVVYQNGVLYAAHNHPEGTLRGLAWRLAPPVTLLGAWRYSARAAGIELDIKESSPAALDQIAAFLKREWDGRPVIVASKDPSVLAVMTKGVPAAFRLMSIDRPAALDAFQKGGGPGAMPDGVTVQESLLDPSSMKWFRSRGLVVLAWTVNDPTRFDQLVDLGVDGVATDNLAITQRLQGRAFTWDR